jgi:hypothetical protein
MSKTHKDLVQFKAKQTTKARPSHASMAPDTSASRYRSASGSQVLNTALVRTTELWDNLSQTLVYNVLLIWPTFCLIWTIVHFCLVWTHKWVTQLPRPYWRCPL